MDAPIYVYYTPLEKYKVIILILDNHTLNSVVYIGNGSFPYPLTMNYISENEFYTNYKVYMNHICLFDFTPTRENLLFISMIERSHIFSTAPIYKTTFPILKTNTIITKKQSQFSKIMVECDICCNHNYKHNLKCCSLIICVVCVEKSKNKCPQCRRHFTFYINYLSTKTYPDYLFTGTLFFNTRAEYIPIKSQIDYFYPHAALIFSAL
jgi:hypothetical protein